METPNESFVRRHLDTYEAAAQMITLSRRPQMTQIKPRISKAGDLWLCYAPETPWAIIYSSSVDGSYRGWYMHVAAQIFQLSFDPDKLAE